MAPAAVVFRNGHLMAHTNDVAALPAVVASLSEAGYGNGHAASAALAAHEEARSAARYNGFSGEPGQIARQLRDAGFSLMAQRVRSSARARGAVAHRDVRLAADIAGAASTWRRGLDPPPSALATSACLRSRMGSSPCTLKNECDH